MKIKKGDRVIILAGKDKGAEGVVVRAMPKEQRVVVEGVNLIKKNTKVTHTGPRGAQEGGIVTKEAPIHVSNVALAEDGKPTRVGYRFDEAGKKVRISRRTGKDV